MATETKNFKIPGNNLYEQIMYGIAHRKELDEMERAKLKEQGYSKWFIDWSLDPKAGREISCLAKMTVLMVAKDIQKVSITLQFGLKADNVNRIQFLAAVHSIMNGREGKTYLPIMELDLSNGPKAMDRREENPIVGIYAGIAKRLGFTGINENEIKTKLHEAFGAFKGTSVIID